MPLTTPDSQRLPALRPLWSGWGSRVKWVASLSCAAVLWGCGGDGAHTVPTPNSPSGPQEQPSVEAPQSEIPAPQPPAPQTPAVKNPRYLQAQPGQVLQVKIQELHPTQGAIGYDQIYYKLGRWQGDFNRPTWLNHPDNQLDYLKRTVGKKFGDYCEDMGAVDLAKDSLTSIDALHNARLDQPGSFACTDAYGSHTENLKTVVIGFDGDLYLTDGHHSFSALREIPDGGDALPVWVKVDANYSDLDSAQAFWQKMTAERKTWLRNGSNKEITPAELPTRLGLQHANEAGGIENDPYRSLVYFSRNIGYKNGSLPEFAEFYWANWLRDQVNLAHYQTIATPSNKAQVLAASTLKKDLSANASDSQDSYAAAVRDAALLMGTVPSTQSITDGKTANELGQIEYAGADADAIKKIRSELEDLVAGDIKKNGAPQGAGKLWFAVNYQLCGKRADNPTCWDNAAQP